MRRLRTPTPRSRSPWARGLATAAATALLLSACGSDDAADDVADGNGAGGGDETIEIVDNDYSPAALEVTVGTTVDWEHVGDVPHTVTFDDGEDSGDLDAGASYSRTFDEAGEFDYVCTIHPAMQATVTVTE